MATAWWWIPGEQWWPAALKDQASALPELTSIICGSCANTCLCSSTVGLTSMAVWATHCLKTLTSGVETPTVSWCGCDLKAGPRYGSPHLENLDSPDGTQAQLLGKEETFT